MKLLLVDSSGIFRLGLRTALTAASPSDVSVVGECGDAQTACELAAATAPDVVVTEMTLPDRSGIALAHELRRIVPGARVLILGSQAAEMVVHQALAAGADGFALKRQSVDDIVAAVHEIARGNTVLPPGMSAPPLTRVAGNGGGPSVDRLSRREREIFDLVVWGSSNKQIADRLGISIKTVETHRGHINGKLRVHTSADIVRFASLWGMLSAPGAASAPPPR